MSIELLLNSASIHQLTRVQDLLLMVRSVGLFTKENINLYLLAFRNISFSLDTSIWKLYKPWIPLREQAFVCILKFTFKLELTLISYLSLSTQYINILYQIIGNAHRASNWRIIIFKSLYLVHVFQLNNFSFIFEKSHRRYRS